MSNIAMENGHRKSGFSHEKWWICPWQNVSSPEGSAFRIWMSLVNLVIPNSLRTGIDGAFIDDLILPNIQFRVCVLRVMFHPGKERGLPSIFHFAEMKNLDNLNIQLKYIQCEAPKIAKLVYKLQ